MQDDRCCHLSVEIPILLKEMRGEAVRPGALVGYTSNNTVLISFVSKGAQSWRFMSAQTLMGTQFNTSWVHNSACTIRCGGLISLIPCHFHIDLLRLKLVPGSRYLDKRHLVQSFIVSMQKISILMFYKSNIHSAEIESLFIAIRPQQDYILFHINRTDEQEQQIHQH